MGDRRWEQFLRVVICLVVVILIMAYIAPKAC